MDWIKIVRWIHIIAGAAWLGEVLAIIFVIVPTIDRMELVDRARSIKLIFPRVFRMASFLSLTAVTAGLTLSYFILLLKVGWIRSWIPWEIVPPKYKSNVSPGISTSSRALVW